MCFLFFGSDLSKKDQTWLNLIKLDISPIKNVTIKSCHIYHEDKYEFWFFGSDLFKMDLTWSNLISQEKKCWYKKCGEGGVWGRGECEEGAGTKG